MAIRDKFRANAAHVLQEGETIQATFGAQSANPYWSVLSYLILLVKNSYRVVIVTDRRIVVCRSGRLRTTPVNAVVRELPRATRIGPATGLWYKCETLGERLYVHKRYHKDIEAADELIPAV